MPKPVELKIKSLIETLKVEIENIKYTKEIYKYN